MFTARVLDADPEGDPPWLATEYVEGRSLREAVLRYGPMPEERLVPLAQGIAEALAAIHAAGLTHRDLKPANVLLSPAGPKVIDFGIARAADATQLTGTGQIIGTLDFMAPEQIEGRDSGPPGDVFALGCTLVHAATGRSPFAAEQTAGTIYKILHAPPDLLGVPPRIARIAESCLAKDPTRRPTAVQLAVGLRGDRGTAVLSAAPPAAPPAARPEPRPTAAFAAEPDPSAAPSRRRRGPVVATVLAVLAVAATVVVAMMVGTVMTRPGGSAATLAPTTAATAAAIDPNGPEARYVDRLCASGALLTALGDSATSPQPTGDPAVAKRDFLAASDRTIGTVEAALSDFTALRDDAPDDRTHTQFGLITTEFTSAKAAFTDARKQVAASEPLTVAVYKKAMNRYLDGTRNLALAATLVKGISLPSSYTAASAVAPRCKN